MSWINWDNLDEVKFVCSQNPTQVSFCIHTLSLCPSGGTGSERLPTKSVCLVPPALPAMGAPAATTCASLLSRQTICTGLNNGDIILDVWAYLKITERRLKTVSTLVGV